MLLTIIIQNGGFVPANNSGNTSFTFNLSVDSKTSAGVYKIDTDGDKIKVRDLWGGRAYTSGAHSETWDGRKDDGTQAIDGTYVVYVMSHNVQTEWEGVIGNTSSALTGSTVYTGYQRMQGMAFSATKGYGCTGITEGNPSYLYFDITNPQSKTWALTPNGTGAGVKFVCTDGTYVYWAGRDIFSSYNWFVFATKVNDSTMVTFSSGTNLQSTLGRLYSAGAISNVSVNVSTITGTDVQNTGNYLFIARGGNNEIKVLNKNTLALVQTITAVTAPQGLAIDNSDNLWVISGTSASRYTVNSDGTLTAPNLTLTGLVAPMAIGVSPTTSEVAVCDGGSSQQVKFYNNNSTTVNNTLGSLGGYTNDATASTGKFSFKEDKAGNTTFIAFLQDGSFYVGDSGNYRNLKYNSSRVYQDQIMFQGTFYAAAGIKSQPGRVFIEGNEYAVDYTKSLDNGINGSWTLAKNWNYALPTTSQWSGFSSVIYISSRTFAQMFDYTNNSCAIVELVAGGQSRMTGITIPADNQLYPDGSLRKVTVFVSGQPTVWSKKDYLGLDGSNNPTWGSWQTVESSPNATNQDPVFYGKSASLTAGERTSTGLQISYDGGMAPPVGSGYMKLGALKSGKWIWQTSKVTHVDYSGEFPSDGAYDIGNTATYGGSKGFAIGRIVATGYHGEFFKQSQANYWDFFYDNGLFICQLGTYRHGGIEAQAGMAGNALSSFILTGPDGNLYLYNNDEGTHDGLLRWKISGLDTISVQTATVNKIGTPVIAPLGNVLLSGLTARTSLTNNTDGWQRSPTTENLTDAGSDYWSVKMGYKTYDLLYPPDLWATYRKTSGSGLVTKDLGTNTGLSSWSVEGYIDWVDNLPIDGNAYFEILDSAGKLLARLRNEFVSGITVYGNTASIVSGANIPTNLPSYFKISATGAIITFTYGTNSTSTAISDNTGTWNNPKTLKLNLFTTPGGASYDRMISVKELLFKTV